MRRPISRLHKWIGVVLGFYLLMMSVSGSSLVFRDELAALISPRIQPVFESNSFFSKNTLKKISYAKVAAAAQAAKKDWHVVWIHDLQRPELPFEVIVDRDAPQNSNGNRQEDILLIDPYRLVVLGSKNAVLQFLVELHTNLLNGKTGRMINGVGAIFLLALSATGPLLWWRGRNSWRRTLGFLAQRHINWRSFSWRLHNFVGILALPMIAVWGLSAFYFGFPDQVKAVLHAGDRPRPAVGLAADREMIVDRKYDLDTQVDAARRLFPGSEVAWIKLPVGADELIQVRLIRPGGDLDQAPIKVFVKTRSGAIARVDNPVKLAASDAFLLSLSRLHFGNFAGVFSKTVWSVLGLAPALLAVSGLLIWGARKLSKNATYSQ